LSLPVAGERNKVVGGNKNLLARTGKESEPGQVSLSQNERGKKGRGRGKGRIKF